jgi:hypothetical protein
MTVSKETKETTWAIIGAIILSIVILVLAKL